MQDDQNRNFYRDSNKADTLTVLIALLATFFIHISAYYIIPQEFVSLKVEKESDELQIEVLPPKIEKKTPEFIEANPFANNDKPTSKDAPESFKDQRAADELPDPTSKSKKPFVDGELKDGKKIVSGTSADKDEFSPEKVFETLQRPLEQPAQPTQPTQSTQSTQATPQNQLQAEQQRESETIKLSDSESENKSDDLSNTSPEPSKESKNTTKTDDEAFIKVEKCSTETSHTAIKKDSKIQKKKSKKETKKTQAEKIKEAKNLRKIEEQQKQENEQPQENIPAPRPRPTLSMKIPAGPLAENRTHASNRGIVACDSRFSEFGAYQQRMIEAISRQWNLLGSKYDLTTAIGSMVIIEFYLNTMGELSKFNIIHTTSTNTGTGLCEQSILTTAPYGEWTQEMVNTFGGQDQSVRITFHYR